MSLIVFSSQFVNDNLASGQWAPAVSQSKSTKFWNSHYYLDYVNILRIIQHRINWDFIISWGQVPAAGEMRDSGISNSYSSLTT